MPNCNVIGCGIKKSGKHPNLTMHQLPTKKEKREIWLKAIGIKNLKMSTKTIHICSLHFEESCFNRTLGKVTLQDDAVPSKKFVDKDVCVPAIRSKPAEISKESGRDFVSRSFAAPNIADCTSVTPHLLVQKYKKIKKLKVICQNQSKELKRLNEKFRRKTKRIAQLRSVIQNLKEILLCAES